MTDAKPSDPAGSHPLHIDIVSDVVCPWCFIGKRHLDQAIRRWVDEFPQRPVSIRWHPFFLNPDTPEEGEPYRPFLERKFGGPERLQQIWNQVRTAGNAAGIAFAFEKIALRANTIKAHRLIHYAQTRDVHTGEKVGTNTTAEQLVDAIFSAQFLNGQHIGDKQVLTQLAAECGFDPVEVERYLDSDADTATIKTAAHRAQQMGISGVPFFIINETLALSGAQGADALLKAMHEAPPRPSVG